MKTLNSYINEKFQIGKDYKRQYAYTPKDKKELIKIILDKIDKEGLGTKDKPLNLNDIDTSKITDMSYLFDGDLHHDDYEKLSKLSWDGYFDICNWNVSSVENMRHMFYGSNFDNDISDWNVSNVNDMGHMFEYSEFKGDISDWDVSKVNDMGYMFTDSVFNGDISNWDVGNVENMYGMFVNCPIENNPPKWYREEE